MGACAMLLSYLLRRASVRCFYFLPLHFPFTPCIHLATNTTTRSGEKSIWALLGWLIWGISQRASVCANKVYVSLFGCRCCLLGPPPASQCLFFPGSVRCAHAEAFLTCSMSPSSVCACRGAGGDAVDFGPKHRPSRPNTIGGSRRDARSVEIMSDYSGIARCQRPPLII